MKGDIILKYHALGNSDLKISVIGLGCMGMWEFYGSVQESESIATLHRDIELGINFFDTADMYGPWTKEISGSTRELGISFVSYSPLGHGFLTGQIKQFVDLAKDDWRRNDPRFQGENFERNLVLVERISEIAQDRKVTPAQLALAWVLVQGENIVTIPGTNHRSYLEQNLKALDVKLTAEDLSRINDVFPSDAAAGTRY